MPEIALTDAVIFSLFGCDILLFLQATLKAIFLFPKKKKPFFIYLTIALTSSVLLSVTQVVTVYFKATPVLQQTLGAVCWLFMIVFSTKVYSIRILSLGVQNRFDWIVSQMPIGFCAFSIVIVIVGLVINFSSVVGKQSISAANEIIVLIFSLVIVLSEIVLYLILFSKISNILEYRNETKRKLLIQLGLSLFVVIVLDVFLIVSKLLSNTLDRYIRPFSYLLRLTYIISFYDSLLDDFLHKQPSTSEHMRVSSRERFSNDSNIFHTI